MTPVRRSRNNSGKQTPGTRLGSIVRNCPELGDRRRSRRFRADSLSGSLSMAVGGCKAKRYTRCALVNISYGGMCFRAPHHMEVGSAAEYRIFLAPLPHAVVVTAEVRWTGTGACNALTGAEFLESSSGWFGPDG